MSLPGGITCEVTRKEVAAEGVVLLELRSAADAELPAWSAGAHIDLHCEPADGVPVVRQYSLCGEPGDRERYQVAVRREPGGRGSGYVHDVLVVGDRVQIGGPRNNFPLVDAARHLLIAGGIGITPLVPMVTELEHAGREWRLVYGGRTSCSMAFADELSALAPNRVSVRPEDEHGLIDLEALLADAEAGTAVYCCGPEPLLAAVEKQTAALGTVELHLERFAAKKVDGRVDTAFEVVAASTGEVLAVPADRTVLSVLEDAGLPVMSSCAAGTCGTCETGVLEGEVDHRDSLLSEPEQEAGDVMFVCVSRARSARLVLDL